MTLASAGMIGQILRSLIPSSLLYGRPLAATLLYIRRLREFRNESDGDNARLQVEVSSRA